MLQNFPDLTREAIRTLHDQKRAIIQRLEGEGQTVAIESAGITLVSGDLRAIVRARRDDVQLSVRDHQRAAAPEGGALDSS